MKMTEEYFYVQEVNDESKFYQQDYAISNKGNKSTDNILIKPNQDVRLHEMEEQLEIAENRCNTLKDQLDHMKKLYQCNRTDISKGSKQTNKKTVYSVYNPSPKRNPVDFLSCSKNTDDRSTPSINRSDKGIVLERQNSKAISTDTSGAAVQTINNILNGITDSVNRLSQIHVHIESDRNERPSSKRVSKTRDSACGDDTPIATMAIQTSPRCSEHTQMKKEEKLIEMPCSFIKTEDICQHSSTVLSIKSKTTTTTKKKTRRRTPYNNKNTLQNSTITVNITNKRSLRSTAKHVEKRFKIEPVKMINKDSSSILSPKKSKRIIRRPRFRALSNIEKNKKQTATETDKLVELYHNNAAKGSDTDDSNPDERKSKTKEVKQRKSSTETVPSLPLDDPSETSMFKRQEQIQRPQLNQQLQYQQPQQPYQHHQPYETIYSSYNNNKQLSPIEENVYMEPTAPRTECYSMCSKNYELPTIASKMKQVAKSYLRRFNFHSIPFCAAKSTSPSHNIGINIQQVMSIIKTRQPVTGISPTLAHNIGLAAEKLQGRPFTAMVSSLGSRIYGKSQCPLTRTNLNYQHLQEMAKEIPEEDEDGNIKRMSEEAMACGDRSSTPVWTVDPASQKNCTCIPQQGVGFQQVLSRYNSNSFSASTVSQFHYRPKTRLSRQIQTAKLRNKLSLTRPSSKPVENKPSLPLKNKEKNLKEVLANLHDEFSHINQQYELLSKRVEDLGTNADEETVKQLEQMERCLSNKEEEITIVMSLYKEVLALKQQVKTLKEKASMASLSMNIQQPYYMQHSRHDPNNAVHLTKLLRQIQMYQEMNRIGRRN